MGEAKSELEENLAKYKDLYIEHKNKLSLIQSLFITDAASNRSVVSSLLGIMDFAPVCNGEISMQDVFVELDRLLDGMELQPGSATYNTLIDVLTFVIENSYVD